jgi:hypothetical protein
MLAVLVVRDGVLPAGGDEVVAECAGHALLIGSGTRAALDDLAGIAANVRLVETDAFRPGAWAGGLATLLALFGGLLSLPSWLVDVSPFAHVPAVPLRSATSSVVVSAVGIALVMAIGVAARRRELTA